MSPKLKKIIEEIANKGVELHDKNGPTGKTQEPRRFESECLDWHMIKYGAEKALSLEALSQVPEVKELIDALRFSGRMDHFMEKRRSALKPFIDLEQSLSKLWQERNKK